MARIHAGFAEVGYLVMFVSGRAELVGQHGEEACAALLVHLADAAGFQHLIDAGVLLIRQVVGGDVLCVEADGLLQVVFPSAVRFARQAIDKIDADVSETGFPAMRYGSYGLPGIVPAIQQFQRGIVKSLYAYADAVERKAVQHGRILFRQVVRIGFERYLVGGFQSVDGFDGFEYLPEILFGQLRGSAASKVDGLHRLSFQIVFAQPQFLAKGTDVLRF